MAVIDFRMETEEDIFKFVQYVTINHKDLLHGYEDYQIILAGNIFIDGVPSYYIVFNDENIVLLTLRDNQPSNSYYIDRQFIDSAYKNHDELTFKYNSQKVFILRGTMSDVTALFEFLNANLEQKKIIADELGDNQGKKNKKGKKDKRKGGIFLPILGLFALGIGVFLLGLFVF